MKRVFRGVIGVAALTLLGAGMASALPQSDAQQKCINKVNKAAIKVQAAQGKANNDCIKDFVKGALGGTCEACIDNDPKNKVEGKQQNVLNDESKNCNAMDLPDFGYTSGLFAGTTAQEAEIDLIHDIYGEPIDGGLFNCDTFPNECLCQRQVTGRIEKLFRAMSKIFVKCKKPALAIGHDPFPLGAASASDLAECISNGAVTQSVAADTKGKVADATTQLGDTATQFCGLGANDEFGAGACATLTGPNLRDCIAKRVKCRFCLMEQAIDALGGAVNCSTFSGTTCP